MSLSTWASGILPELERILDECNRTKDDLLRMQDDPGPLLPAADWVIEFFMALFWASGLSVTLNTGLSNKGTGTAQDFVDTASPFDPYG